jgi:DNA polymerase-3 subunit alpha
MAKDFIHLHVHTEYSLLDGLSKISDMLAYTKELGMDSIAITDHGTMYGVIEFYKKSKNEGVKPIIGMEAYTTNVSLKSRPERGKFKNFHLILLAKNKTGYKNLMRLTSIAHLEGYYYRPRVDRETLTKYSKGLICTSGCPQGEVPQALMNGSIAQAKDIAKWFLDVFGSDYYLEVQRHEYGKYVKKTDNESVKRELSQLSENEKIINKGIIKISRELGIPLVATNDTHYVKPEDATAQDALVCIATGKNVSDIKRLRFIDSPNFYIKSPDEMNELFKDIPDAVGNTVKIADKCNITITLDKWFFPKYELEEGKTADQEIEEKTWEGIKQRVAKVTPEIKQRLEYELDIIIKKGYSTYFLIVSDISRWAKDAGIITNTRGSAAGSLVSFALGIIDINPLTYDLPFERFLTPWRPSPPDIDFDIADNRREEIINYISSRYGKDKVAQICTFGRMLARGSVRDIARVLGFPYSTGDKISKTIPLGSQGFPMNIEKALDMSVDLREMYKTDEDTKQIVDLARQVEGNARHISVHAAGVVIAPDDITNYTPLQLDPDGKKVITQYDMDALDPNVSPGEAVGLLKFDLLGLRNLSTLGAAIEIVKEIRGVEVDIHKISLNDKKTFEMLSRGETMGVFQLSGSGMTRYLKELKPTRVEDLMVMVALYRPGPMAQIPEFIERKNNPGKVTYFDPRMKEYLGKSYGLLVYQDDVFMTAIKIAGYSWEESDKFRKAVGKKIPQEMERQRKKFIDGAIKNGMEKAKAEELFQLIEPFSGYGFNKAHAVSYGMVAYWTGYMKANYPVEFMCALLTAESSDTDKVSTAVNECRRVGIKVYPPDINESDIGFKIVNDKESRDGKAILFGLSAIKHVGKAAISAIIDARSEGKFLTFTDFLARVDARRVNKKVVESLIKVGGLSSFGRRASLLSSMDDIRNKLSKPKGSVNQQGLFTQDEIKKAMSIDKMLPDTQMEEFSDEEIQNLERQLLGFSLSAKPVGELISTLTPLATHKIQDIFQEITQNVRVAIVVDEVRIVVTKTTGREMAFVKAKDDTGSLDLIVFPKLYQNTRQHWIDNKPLLITGKVDTRDGSTSIIVNQVDVKGDLSENGEHLYIRIPEGVTPVHLKRLRSLLVTNPGSQKVSLLFEGNNNKNVQLNIEVSWDEELARKISEVLKIKEKAS